MKNSFDCKAKQAVCLVENVTCIMIKGMAGIIIITVTVIAMTIAYMVCSPLIIYRYIKRECRK